MASSDDDGPRFLSTPPASPPVAPTAATQPVIVLPPSPPPYRTAGRPVESTPAPRRAPTREREPIETVAKVGEFDPAQFFGDAAGEHHTMTRGRYGAWIYVVIACVFEALLFAAPGLILAYDVLPAGGAQAVVAMTSVVAGLGLAVWAFNDRWRCIEAFASRFCSGLMNLSILYVPFVALIYANVRLLAKRRGE